MSLLQIEPLPTPSRYDQAYGEVRGELDQLGGVESFLANRALEMSFDETLIEQDREVAQYGLRFIDTTLVSDDEEAYNAAFAYISGYVVSNPVLDRLYRSPHTFENRVSSVRQWFASIDTSDIEDADELLKAEQFHLEKFGVYGLRQLGAQAMDVVTDWSHRLYPEQERLARMFCMGTGTMVASGLMQQKAINEWLLGQSQELSSAGNIEKWLESLTDEGTEFTGRDDNDIQ